MNTKINQSCIDVCNSLLRGEISAVETYRKAIEKYPDTPATSELIRIQSEHSKSVNRLAGNVRDMGGIPDNDSGAWGVFTKAVQSSANLLGAESAIESLQRGEEHGRNDYHSALDNEDVMDTCKALIREELLPRVENHIIALERLEDSVD